MSRLTDPTFLSGPNAAFIAELYARYLDDPLSVDASWRGFFDDLADPPEAVERELEGPGWGEARPHLIGNGALAANGHGALLPGDAQQAALDSVRAVALIRGYRVRGHLIADLDPLGLDRCQSHPDLEPATYGFAEADLDRPIFINDLLGFRTATLRQILDALKAIYCGTVGIEYMHMQELEERRWIQARIEVPRNHTEFTPEGKRAILERLTAAEQLERFLDRRYTGTKRFGLEGGEALIPALEQVIKRGGQLGMQELIIGMPHRGRLNVLTNVMGKPFAALFSEFQGNPANPEDVQGSGDVKYHLGTSTDREIGDIRMHLSLTANPSHLEAVNPVVLGKVRAKQRQRGGDGARDAVVGLLMHGDAAFAGQGLVPESLDLSELRGYRTGGTIHVIVNNQIGFTTSPAQARSAPYSSDVAKGNQAPIFHVNGDDAEAVVHVARIATEFRQRFKKDVVVDIFCYRRHGHNEADEPAFTQPLMYRAIASPPDRARDLCRAPGRRRPRDVGRGREDADATSSPGSSANSRRRRAIARTRPTGSKALGRALPSPRATTAAARPRCRCELLHEVGAALTRVPEGFHLNPKIARQLEQKRQRSSAARGSTGRPPRRSPSARCCAEGTFVRLSGQDSGRGTFSQRHAVLVDQETEERYVPLNHVRDGQAGFEIVDSPLSEAAVLGFEYGYSLAEPHALVMWEAQFGDFANGAQVIIDQFIASGEAKWLRMSGLVLLLPHGYEGQGPEHSSARLERYLQLCGEDNIQVCNLTTAANYFHALRRQVRRNFRKPLVLMTPKSLLRAPELASPLERDGTRHLVPPPHPRDRQDRARRQGAARRLVQRQDLFRSAEGAARAAKSTTSPSCGSSSSIPSRRRPWRRCWRRYRNAELVWCQEEPENMGAWYFVDRRIEKALAAVDIKAKRARYVGRPEAAATATGLLRRHNAEQARLVAAALQP